MLALTDNALAVIRQITESPQVPDGAGLRIAPAVGGNGELQLSLQPTPEPGDEVIDDAGARVFLDSQAAELLSDQTLDAEVNDGEAGFYLRTQAS